VGYLLDTGLKLPNKINFINHPFPKKNMVDLVNLPLEIIYGLIANKWLFKTFKNNIGLIGASEKLRVIKKLMQYKAYQNYIGTDYFTDYIEIPQRGAFDDEGLEMNIVRNIKKSTCGIFLIGAGVSKLKFFYLLKKNKNCVYIDVGHGICMIASYGDHTRPYCGTWKNYRLKSLNSRGYQKDREIDLLTLDKTPIIYLD